MKFSRRTPAVLFMLCMGFVFLNFTGNIVAVSGR